ncbi:Hypothetical protein A7982_03131 [Minicystis rosea]|nr:Hypothetical protein A7982_03131 [Minicystis rosea]
MNDDEDDIPAPRRAVQLGLFELARHDASEATQRNAYELPRGGDAENAAQRHAARRNAPEPAPTNEKTETSSPRKRRSASEPRSADTGKRRFTPRIEPAPLDEEEELTSRHGTDWDRIPDVRDGLTRVERVILVCLQKAQEEKRGRMVSTAMLYGRVVEHVNISVPEFQRLLQRLVGLR